ncbi:MAG: polyprenol monophosphomannose synthase [Deltaproteobacteria bacterium]|nr:polyprenol monophosphomannose synthase [Deltaproteobacteria bacterium]
MNEPRVVAVVPTYNERESLPRLIERIEGFHLSLDVMVVDDASPDGTGAWAQARASVDPRVRVIQRPKKEGIGQAYLAGFAQALRAGYDVVIQMDGDLSHRVEDLPRLLEPVLSGRCDLSLGSRYVRGGGTAGWGWHRRLLSRFGNFYARSILGVSIRDLTSGFKCCRAEWVRALEAWSPRMRGYGFQIEQTYRLLRAGARVQEVPILFVERAHGTSKMGLRIAGEAVWGVWRLRLGAPGARAGAALWPFR